ncbi:MAG: glycosyltransferase family 2 protein [Firmicutes bacterium]|jgi:glycosyltransferase involved in cell wall biosynthesis|nr:glycosyltransferase family 2 protein [Bacillota bacterium]
MQVSAVIPAFNEEETIAATVLALQSVSAVNEIVVVDDGSWDMTSKKAREAGAAVVSLPRNTGKAGALAAGVKQARGEILCFVDADLGPSAAEFACLIPPVVTGQADMVIAAFSPASHRGGFGLVKNLARAAIRLGGGFHSTCPLSGQRVLRREVWEKAGYGLRGFGVEVGLTISSLRHGFRVCEIPVAMTHRETGRDLAGFVHRARQFVDVARTCGYLWLKQRERS